MKKKSLKIKSLILCLVSLFFAMMICACDNGFDFGVKKPQEQLYSIGGNVQNSGTAPDKNSSRTAKPVLPADLIYKISLDLVTTGTPKSYTIISEDGSFDFAVPAGTYSLSAKVYAASSEAEISENNLILSGTYSDAITVNADNSEDSLEITVEPTRNNKGSVNMPLSVQNPAAVKSVKATWGAAGKQILNISSGTAYFTMNSTYDSSDVENYPFDIDSGVYKVRFAFYSGAVTGSGATADVSGTLVYSCDETINVYDNFVTDTWLESNAPYFSDDGLEIDSDCIEAFTVKEVYVKTPASGVDASSNTGTFFDPFPDIQSAVEKIELINDTVSEYSINLLSDISPASQSECMDLSATDGNTFVNLNTTSSLNLKIKSYKATTPYKINANGNATSARAIYVGSKVALTLENIEVTGGKLTNANGAGIFNEGTLTVGSGAKISGNTVTGSGLGAGIFVQDSSATEVSEIILKGSADVTNDIYLSKNFAGTENKVLKIDGALGSSTVNVSLAQYGTGQKVVESSSSAIMSGALSKLNINSTDYDLLGISEEGKLRGPLTMYVYGDSATDLVADAGGVEDGTLSSPFSNIDDAISCAEANYALETLAGVSHSQFGINLDGNLTNKTSGSVGNNYSQITIGNTNACNVLLQGYGTNGGTLIATSAEVTNARNICISDDFASTVVLGNNLNLTEGNLDKDFDILGNSVYLGKTSNLTVQGNVNITKEIYLPKNGETQTVINADSLTTQIRIIPESIDLGVALVGSGAEDYSDKFTLCSTFGTNSANTLEVDSEGKLSGTLPVLTLYSWLPAEIHVNSTLVGVKPKFRILSHYDYRYWETSIDGEEWTQINTSLDSYWETVTVTEGTSYLRIRYYDGFGSTVTDTCTIICDPVYDSIGMIYYDDKTYSSEYDSTKTAVGVVLDADASDLDENGLAKPTKLVHLNQMDNVAFAAADSEGATKTINNVSQSEGSGNWAKLQASVSDAGTVGKYPAYDYVNSLPGATWFIPANHELEQMAVNLSVINESIELLSSYMNTTRLGDTTSDVYRYWSSSDRGSISGAYYSYAKRMSNYMMYSLRTATCDANNVMAVRPICLTSTVIGNANAGGDISENLPSDVVVGFVSANASESADTVLDITASLGGTDVSSDLTITGISFKRSNGEDIPAALASLLTFDLAAKTVTVKAGIALGTTINVYITGTYKGYNFSTTKVIRVVE